MKKQMMEQREIPNSRQRRGLLALARNPELQACISSLLETPAGWDEAMADPAAWLRERDIKLPRGMQAVFTKDISISQPLEPDLLGMPGPDWVPYELKFSQCRSYWVPVRDDTGRLIKYTQETICFGFEIMLNRQPGPFG